MCELVVPLCLGTLVVWTISLTVMYEPVFYVCWGWPCMVPMHYFKFVKCLCKFLWRKKTSLCHVLPRQRPRAATSTPTEHLLAQHVSTYEPNTCQPTSPTRFNQRAQHVSIYQPYTCQPCDHTRVRCKPAETVQWRGKIVMDVTISMTKYTKLSRCNSYDATKMTKMISS